MQKDKFSDDDDDEDDEYGDEICNRMEQTDSASEASSIADISHGHIIVNQSSLGVKLGNQVTDTVCFNWPMLRLQAPDEDDWIA